MTSRQGGGTSAVRAGMAMAGTVLAGAALAGCALLPSPSIEAPVAPGPLGPIRPAPDGGLPIECRGVPVERCMEVGSGIPADARAIRIIVSCEIAVCSEAGAAFRLDSVDATGKTANVGRGTWGTTEQP